VAIALDLTVNPRSTVGVVLDLGETVRDLRHRAAEGAASFVEGLRLVADRYGLVVLTTPQPVAEIRDMLREVPDGTLERIQILSERDGGTAVERLVRDAGVVSVVCVIDAAPALETPWTLLRLCADSSTAMTRLACVGVGTVLTGQFPWMFDVEVPGLRELGNLLIHLGREGTLPSSGA
jgi:hypothetical protein